MWAAGIQIDNEPDSLAGAEQYNAAQRSKTVSHYQGQFGPWLHNIIRLTRETDQSHSQATGLPQRMADECQYADEAYTPVASSAVPIGGASMSNVDADGWRRDRRSMARIPVTWKPVREASALSSLIQLQSKPA